MPYQRPRVPIGRRREKVTIQSPVVSDDGMGGKTVTKWQTVGEPWAAVEALDERIQEQTMAGQVTARLAYHVTMPYRTDVSPDLRMIVRDTTMEIQSAVDDTGQRQRLVVYVRQVQA